MLSIVMDLLGEKRFSGDRDFSTCVYFLLNKQDFSSS